MSILVLPNPIVILQNTKVILFAETPSTLYKKNNKYSSSSHTPVYVNTPQKHGENIILICRAATYTSTDVKVCLPNAAFSF